MEDDEKGRCKAVAGDQNRGKPADGIAAYGSDVVIKTIQDIPVGVTCHGKPVRVHDFIKNIRLDIVIDGDA